MKKLLFLSSILFGTFCSGQDSILLDEIWFIHETVISTETLTIPNLSAEGTLNFIDQSSFEISHNTCGVGFAGSIVFMDSNIFEISNGGNVLVGFCDNPDVNSFIDSHFNVYHINSDIANNPFSYVITDNDNVLTLTITNGNGDTAIYRNEVLSLEDNNLSQLQLFYNDRAQEVVLSGTEQEVQTTIYTITGQKQLTVIQASNQAISVKTLPSGVYLVAITNSNNESQTYKFIKY